MFGHGSALTPKPNFVLVISSAGAERIGHMDFMQDCADRIKGRVQITTDGHKCISRSRRETPLECDVDYAQLQKIYGCFP